MAHEISFESIKRAVAAVAGMRLSDLEGPRRWKAYAQPRQTTCLLARRIRPDLSLPNLGRRLGGRDHTSILHAARRAEARLEAGDEGEVLRVYAALNRLGLEELPGASPTRRPIYLIRHELDLARTRVAQLEAELARSRSEH
ncbi:MAG: helix-turn-helix domain-containing protein [Phenylobacterium sp.]|uniref:helix-turn-helix domain-containing protein n=1 Tax=Phenylobacterium sp. TaxID=1871053 RepID=UPI003919D8F8